MIDSFDLPVTLKGEELLFPTQLQLTGYIHRFVVDVYGTEVILEPDEERNYRAVFEQDKLTKRVTVELIQAITKAIECIVK